MKYSYIYKVENKNRYRTAARTYYLIRTHANDLLFTKSDITAAKLRADKNIEDIPKKSVGPLDNFSALWYIIGLVVGGVICGGLIYLLKDVL